VSQDRSSTPFAVRRRLGSLGRGARKALGQHFLNSPAIASRIVAAARLTGDEHVIEIGPGLGALSLIAAEQCRQLTLIELDRDFAEQLRQQFADRPHVTVCEADILSLPFDRVLTGETIAIGNLPYNIGTAILARLLDEPRIRRIVAMVQLEVAQRLMAKPGSKNYGLLSVFTQLSARVDLAIKVRPGAFVPPPNVDSAVVVIEPHGRPPVEIDDHQHFREIVRAAFGQRRKQLANSLKAAVPDPIGLLRQAEIDPTRRPETLTLAELARLSNQSSRRN